MLGLAESRLSSEEGVGRVERERRTEEPRQGRGGRGAGKEKEENVASEKETEKRAQRRIKPSQNWKQTTTLRFGNVCKIKK